MGVNWSGLGVAYRRVYAVICGQSPHEFPWHFQWLSTLYLHRRLSQLLPEYGGKVLDVGCGAKPYKPWFGAVSEYTGIDVAAGAEVDFVIDPNEKWPLPDGHFDVLLSTQVIEHVENLDLVLAEVRRVTRKNGVVILSFPFLYPLHGAPFDFRRLTYFGAANLLRGFEVISVETQGGIGSTLAILFLNWIDTALSKNTLTRLLKVLITPLFIVVSFGLYLIGLLLDWLDGTKAFYSNVLLVARKVS